MKSKTKNPPPPFIAFYSFKGGVGRSMALINAACILAGHGRRVLAIDLDLEAPGISYLLLREKPRSKPAKGFIDFIYDLLLRGEKSPLASTKNPTAFLKYTAALPLPEILQRVPGGSLRIMPAGRIDANYEKHRQAIDLHRLYLEQKGEPIIQHLRNLIIESGAFDYVLIDSRTGFADEAGISVRDLADHLVVLHGLNHQNIEGTARFLSRFKQRVKRAKEMKIAFVASPIPLGEDDLCEKRIKHAARCFRAAIGESVKLDLQIPYHPRLALDESPFIFRRTQGALHHAYGRIENQLREFNSDTESEWTSRFRMCMRDDKPDEAIECIRKLGTLNEDRAKFLARRAVDESVGKESFIHYWDFFNSLTGQDLNSLVRAVEHFKKIEQRDQVERLYHEMLPLVSRDADRLDEIARFFWHERKNAAEANRLFSLAVKVSPQNARVLCNYGSFQENLLRDFAKAAQLFRRATKVKPDYARAYVLLGELLEERYKKYAAAERQYRRAIAAAPKDGETMRRLAWLLAQKKEKFAEAERLMRKSVVLEKQNANAVGALATILWQYRQNYSGAREQYRQALVLDARHANNAGNFAGFLLAHAKLNEAEKQIVAAWNLTYADPWQGTAEVAFYRVLCLRLQNKPVTTPLGYLKHLFARGYERSDWSFDDMLRILDFRIPAKEVRFYRALSEAILDSRKVEHLNTFEQWPKVKPLPPSKDI